MKEGSYDFRKKLLAVHEENVRDKKRVSSEQEYTVSDGAIIRISKEADEVIKTAAEDFREYLSVSMGVNAYVTDKGNKSDIHICLARECGENLGEYGVYRGFRIKTDSDGILICGHDSRGTAAGLYFLEDMMTFEKAPVCKYGIFSKKPLFSPQMVHSGYGLDEYPDKYLQRIAHEGRDAILVFAKGVNETPSGFLDFNDLIGRAARYGIDVYAYSYIVSELHPDDEKAESHYESTYGELFKRCPGLKGVTLVGESVMFPTKDKNAEPGRSSNFAYYGIPTGKPSSGWWPCSDYPQWLDMIKKVIRKYNKNADIVFWTYNWGNKPKEARLRLIESLPTDITLMATFEMFEPRRYGNAYGHIGDYSLAIAGPGEYFSSEAEAAKRRGIRMYAMTNTGGLTWDIGVIPYQPMPYQWMRRYKEMRKAYENWGLCGIMESHHYGFYPSFISKLSKWCFFMPYENEILKKILISEFGKSNFKEVDEALRLMSEAEEYFTPSDADQYGAFRVGPSYPFCLDEKINVPSLEKALWGNRICSPTYDEYPLPQDAPLAVRVPEELKSLEVMEQKASEAADILKGIKNPNHKLEELANLCEFIKNTVHTGVNAKKWFLLKNRLNTETDKNKLYEILDDMTKLLLDERKNAQNTIPVAEKDSRLGWEPSMLYMTDSWHLDWKIKQIDYVINKELPVHRRRADKINSGR